MKVNISFSVIICSRSRPQQLDRCLQCLANQSSLPEEIILVEDITENQSCSKKKLEQYFPNKKIHCIYKKTKAACLSVSRNIGLKNATKKIILFIDDDVVFKLDLVKNYRVLHQKYSDAIGFVGRVFPLRNDRFSRFGSWQMSGEYLSEKRMRKIIFYAGSTFSLVKKTVTKHKLLYKENWKSGEDIDFFIRLHQKKENLYFHPQLKTWHSFQHKLWPFLEKHISYAHFFTLLTKYYPIFFSIEKYLPTKRIQLLLPFFCIKKSWVYATSLVNDGFLEKDLFLPAFIAELATFIGIYTSQEGRVLLQKRLKLLFLGEYDADCNHLY